MLGGDPFGGRIGVGTLGNGAGGGRAGSSGMGGAVRRDIASGRPGGAVAQGGAEASPGDVKGGRRERVRLAAVLRTLMSLRRKDYAACEARLKRDIEGVRREQAELRGGAGVG